MTLEVVYIDYAVLISWRESIDRERALEKNVRTTGKSRTALPR